MSEKELDLREACDGKRDHPQMQACCSTQWQCQRSRNRDHRESGPW